MKAILGVFVAVALVFVLFVSGVFSDSAKEGAARTGGNATDIAKDPGRVTDAAGDATDKVTAFTGPWWHWLVTQPWFYAAVIAGVIAFLLRKMIMGMNPTARMVLLGLGVAVVCIVWLNG